MIKLVCTKNSPENMIGDQVHYKVILSGRTKGNQISASQFLLPRINITSCTGLDPGTWIGQLVELWSEEGNENGRLFLEG